MPFNLGSDVVLSQKCVFAQITFKMVKQEMLLLEYSFCILLLKGCMHLGVLLLSMFLRDSSFGS